LSDSNGTQQKLDPTESIRTIQSKGFKEEFVTLREHEDTTLHYIGGALPMPSDSECAPIGIGEDAGDSPMPARADHSHDTRLLYGGFRSNGDLVCAPGSSYISNLINVSGKNMLASGQVIAFPEHGVYLIESIMSIRKSVIDVLIGEVNVNHVTNNGGTSKNVWRSSNFDIPDYVTLNYADVFRTTTAPSLADNIQVNLQHNDNSNWYVQLGITVFRLCAVTSV
jgi:hypothetical protein